MSKEPEIGGLFYLQVFTIFPHCSYSTQIMHWLFKNAFKTTFRLNIRNYYQFYVLF